MYLSSFLRNLIIFGCIIIKSFFKKIEIAVKKKVNFFLFNSNATPVLINKAEPVFQLSSKAKILILRQDRIGDVLVSVPFFRNLKEALPDANIDVVFGKKNIQAKKAIEKYINKIYVYEKNVLNTISLIRSIRKNRYDLIIDLFDNASTTSSMFVKLSKAKYKLGIEKENSGIYSHIVPLLNKTKFHIVERIAQLLLPFGINPASVDLSLAYLVTEEEKAKAKNFFGEKQKSLRLGINLAGSNRNKFWGVENNIEFINTLNKEFPFIEPVLFGTKEYSAEIEKISIEAKIKIAPKVNSMHDWVCLLSQCDLIVTTDTSAVHFAACLKIPCIALYNYAIDEKFGVYWYPYNSPYRIIGAESGRLSDISAQDAIQKLRELIEENFSL
jgi:ADP-heptose:LPS heptosyltransferase